MRNTLLLLLVSGFLLLAGCATNTGSTQAPKLNPQAQAVSAYQIGVDDELKISVWQNPDLDVSVPVRPDGKISVPLVGDVEAGGHTPEEVAAEIQSK
ncbi:MAG TPA: polysaccharide biosynthesis/export family protein, partial [Rhodanobacteraceae bacterium]|nr:polysaccharide biosynthesis/export family protein [Rhodanobacteraceae bacterium]